MILSKILNKTKDKPKNKIKLKFLNSSRYNSFFLFKKFFDTKKPIPKRIIPIFITR